MATTHAGLPLYGRVVVVVADPGTGGLAPSLLVTASPEDASLLTPGTVSAFLEGVAPAAKLTGVEVDWPDLIDASPTVTPTSSGITVTSQHAVAEPGYYDVPVTVQLDGQPAPLTATVHLTVGNIDGSPPSPVVVMAPASATLAGRPYLPGQTGATPSTLLVAGDGPFAFGPAAPSPSNFSVDGDGKVSWTPTRAQVGPERLAVRIVDAQGQQTVKSWVVEVTAGKGGGCALAAGAAPSSALPLGLVVLWLLVRRRRAATV